MKKIFLILVGIAIILIATITILYQNNQNKNEEVIDIFKEESETERESAEDVQQKTDETIEKVIVDIKGMVASPGVYEVDSSARVNDVISLAGGLIEGADTSHINLAKIVTDEMTIIIYSKEEILEKYKNEICICDCPDITNDACINTERTEENNILININTASKEELMTISGIGQSKAESIIKYREENGLFNTIDDIKNVSGIGETLFEEIKNYITV